MKLSVGKRFLMFFHWLLSLLICAAFAVYLIVPEFIMKYYTAVEEAVGLTYIRVIGIGILVIYAALAIAQIYLIFKRRKRSERGFITVDSSDSGRVRIAVSAVEQMVRQSVNSIDGITEMKIGIDSVDDAIVIAVRAIILNGSHVPTITMNMQRAIRQFVEMNCGVAVREVSISINAVSDAQEAPRHRRFGRSKTDAQKTAFQTPALTTPASEDYENAQQSVPSEPERREEPAFTPAPVEPEQAAFDPDKPYESEFAKDLAAMKARNADQSEAEEDDESPKLDDAY